MRSVLFAAIVGGGMLMAACGSSSPTQPSTVQVAGVWVGTVTQTGASGGPECLALFQQSNGLGDRYTLSITQTGSALTATASSQTTGQACSYTGTAGMNTVSLNASSCQPPGYQVTCNFLQRDIVVASHSVTGNVSGSTMTGTTGANWSVFQRGMTTGLGVVTVNDSFTLTRQ